MTWDSQNTHYKLALAGMLHDVALPNPDWALFETEGDLSGLSASELEEYRRHPLLAGEMASQLADFPGDVDYIIAQHHELPDGSGFPRGLNHTKISPLSSLFIVSHDICHRLYAEGEKFDFARFLDDFDRRYPLGYFRRIRTSLEALDLNKI
jgi:response regulator RpfG family c-di-GMP phosphodiesterase